MAPRNKPAAVVTESDLLSGILGSGILGSGTGSIPVSFFGESYASMRDVPTAVLAKVGAADLETCGNPQARAVFSRTVRDRARAEGLLN